MALNIGGFRPARYQNGVAGDIMAGNARLAGPLPVPCNIKLNIGISCI